MISRSSMTTAALLVCLATTLLSAQGGPPAATDASTALGLVDSLLFAIGQQPSNRPPTVSIFETVTTLYADSPSAGALLQLNSIASDPDGDTLTYSWTGPFTDNPVTTEHFLVARVPLGQQTVTLTVDDGHGHVVSASRTFDVVGAPFVGTTATPIDSQINALVFNYAPVTITASGIGAAGGQAYLHTRLDQNPPIPAHLQAGSPPIYFELSSDAVLVTPLSVCIDTRGMSLANPANIRLYQYRQSGQLSFWTDVTSPGYPQGHQLCGESNSLGTFAIFYPQVPSTAVETIAGNGVRAGSNDGPGGNPIDDLIDGPARQTALPYLYGGAYDRANNRLFVSGAGAIYALNLSDDTIRQVAGDADLGFPMELAVSPGGDLVFVDWNACVVRRIDLAQGSLHTVAGNGTCGFSGDGGAATLASISAGAMAFDAAGNLFLADTNAAAIRRIDAATGIIDTVAGDGGYNTPIDGAPALSPIGMPLGLAFDAQGHLIVAAGMHLIRISPGAADALIDGDPDEVIRVLGGCNTNCQAPFNGDGLPISHPRGYLPGLGHVTIAQDGALLFRDYFRIRRVAPGADGIVTGASDEIVSTIAGYYDWETLSLIPNFNGDTFSTQSLFSPVQFIADDPQGRIIVVDGNNVRVRRFGLPPSGAASLTIETLGVADAAAGQPYSATITAAGGSGTGYGWSISAGALPAGLTLAATGTPGTTISGTPTLGGTFDFTVGVTDSGGNTASRAFTLVVAHAVMQINVTENIVVADSVAPRPSAMIRVNEAITVSDAPATSADNSAPVLSLPPTIVAEAQAPGGAIVTFAATATDDSAGAVTVTCVPASGALFPFNGATPTTTTVGCTATDSSGNTATATFDVVVRDTTAPLVLASPITVAATEPAGARANVPQAPHTAILQQIPLLAGALDAADPNPVRVSAQWVACADPAEVLGPILNTTLYPVGPNCFFYMFRDGSGNVGSGIGTIEVSSPIGGPVVAANVAVIATDLFNVPLPVTATFPAVDQPGLLTAVPPSLVPPLPASLVFAGAPLEIRSTALAPDTVVVCIRPPAGEFAERLLVLENGQWVDRTESVDPVTGEICGRPGPLGASALVRRDVSGLTLRLTPSGPEVRPVGSSLQLRAEVLDTSVEQTRVAIRSAIDLNVEFRHPRVPDSLLSLFVERDASGVPRNLVVSLATGSLGELRSTANDVATLINAAAPSQIGAMIEASWWPETGGEGIVAPRPLLRLARLFIRSDTFGPMASCYTSTPGFCTHEFTRGDPANENVSVVLDLNHNGVRDDEELSSAMLVTWIDVPAADLSVSVTASPTSVNVGQEVTFDVVLSNLGPADAPTARLSVVLPPFDLNLVNLSAPGMSCSLAAGLTCDFTNFVAGTTRTVRVVAATGSAGALTATFAVSSATNDPNAANNSASATVTVAAGADLSLVVTAPPTAVAGGVLRYTVTVINNGPSQAAGVTITMPVPAGFSLSHVNSPGGPCILPVLGLPGSVTCFVNTPMLIRGEYVMTIDGVPNAVGTLSNTFRVTGTLHDPNPADNEATVTVTVTPGADMALTAVPSRTLLSAGESLTYAITARNNGPATAMGATAAITADPGYTIDQITLPGLACTTILFTRTWTCGLGNIASGATVQFSVVGRVISSNPGTNRFSAGSTTADPNPANSTVAVPFDARSTVTINQASGQMDPATAAPVLFSVTFSEAVTGFSGADVAFSGSTVGGSLAATATGSGASYTVSVSGMTGVGLVVVSIPAGAAVDSGGNASAASTSTDRSVLFGLSSVLAYLTPSNAGNVALTAFNSGGQLSGLLLYTRGSVWFAATRFTSLVVNGQTATLEGFTTNNRFFAVTVRDGGSGHPDTFRLWMDGVEQTAGGAVSNGTVTVTPWAPDTRLKGWVDLHTHPMSNLAFGGKLFHGAPSVGSLMPAVQMPNDPGCRFDVRATSITEALSQDGPTRGDNFQSACGNAGRNLVIKALEAANGAVTAPAGADGYPAFTYWPKWNDITHQKMWIDWIRRSWQGGQRVMVALSHNNRALASLLGSGAAISGVRTDAASSDLQIEEIKRLVADHPDFMAVATTPNELHAIVQGGRLAIVLGVELDKIGDFSTNAPPSQQAVDDEIGRLYTQGVRYILPIHFVDNAFGDTAVHNPLFNLLNFHENQTFFTLGCAQLSDGIGFQSTTVPAILAPFMLGGMPALFAPTCLQGATFLGHVNTRLANGLTTTGEFAIRAMMRRGMIVDIDHMSNRAANRTLAIANGIAGGGYPINSGHSGIRERNSSQLNAENSRTPDQLARIACLGGMFGLGTDTAGAQRWAAQYEVGYTVMRRAFAPNGLCPGAAPLGTGFIGLGTDANSFVKTPVPPMLDPGGLPRFADIYNPSNPLNAGVSPLFTSTTGTKTWDYNIDGVAHYGMFVDFLRDVRMWTPAGGGMNGRQIFDDQMMYGADYFHRMWLKADTQKARIPNP